MQDRSDDIIVQSILQAARKESTILGIMHHAFLTHRNAASYLDRLTKEGLVSYSPASRSYRITPDGERYLESA